jgi:hypothetical protein
MPGLENEEISPTAKSNGILDTRKYEIGKTGILSELG